MKIFRPNLTDLAWVFCVAIPMIVVTIALPIFYGSQLVNLTYLGPLFTFMALLVVLKFAQWPGLAKCFIDSLKILLSSLGMVLFYVAMLTMLFYFLPLNPQPNPTQFVILLKQTLTLQPWSISVFVASLILVNHSRKNSFLLSDILTSLNKGRVQRNLGYAINGYATQAFIVLLAWLIVFATLLLSNGVCYLLHVPMISGSKFSVFIMGSLILIVVTNPMMNIFLRKLLRHGLSQFSIFILFIICLTLILVGVSVLSQLASLYFPPMLPNIPSVNIKINDDEVVFSLFNYAIWIVISFFWSFIWVRFFDRKNFWSLAIGGVILPTLLGYALLNNDVWLTKTVFGINVFPQYYLLIGWIVSLLGVGLLIFLFCHVREYLLRQVQGLIVTQCKRKLHRAYLIDRHFFTAALMFMLYLFSGLVVLHVLLFAITGPILVIYIFLIFAALFSKRRIDE